ncbi:MAG: hypothetical protein M3O50_07250, partial [Myxococcota bacterium]|nr:hypothetical protein [Myxococcota bacterium]
VALRLIGICTRFGVSPKPKAVRSASGADLGETVVVRPGMLGKQQPADGRLGKRGWQRQLSGQRARSAQAIFLRPSLIELLRCSARR